ncbi:MAG: cysteine desulfurase [Propionibacteriaceae bacterium]|nr:cysteine desulfurase [Propionibacteriaceae bacterium]
MSHYFDHAATTVMRPAAIQAWVDHAQQWGNPSSIHGAGRQARKVVEDSRDTIADLLGVDPFDLVFTSGGTEADNLAVLGVARARKAADPARTVILISPTEHHAVLDPALSLVEEGFTILEGPVDADGLVDLDAWAALIGEHRRRLALVACMWVNNEVGTIQPVAALADLCAAESIPFHCDAVQAHLVWEDPPSSTTLALSAHKFGGPMGIGALVVPRTLSVSPTSFGGGQERKLRSGTVPVPLIASFAQAMVAARQDRDRDLARLTEVSRRVESVLTSAGAQIVGQGAPRTPAITYALFPGCANQDLIVLLDAAEVHVSTGSACAAGIPQPSHVLCALGSSDAEARTGLRFSLGWTTTQEDVDALASVLPAAVDRLRGTSWRA